MFLQHPQNNCVYVQYCTVQYNSSLIPGLFKKLKKIFCKINLSLIHLFTFFFTLFAQQNEQNDLMPISQGLRSPCGDAWSES